MKAFQTILLLLLIPISLISRQDIASGIKTKLEQLAVNPDFKVGGEKYHNIEYVSNLYQKNNYQPFWTEQESIDDAVEAILTSYEDGLIPQDYHLDAIKALSQDLSISSMSSEDKADMAADLELLVTDGVLYYAYHLLYGKCDPITFTPTWNFEYAPIPDLDPEDLRLSITSGNILSRLTNLRPRLHLYDTLMTTLAFYREIESKGGWQSIAEGGKIEPGDDDTRIPQVRQRLRISGDLTSLDTMISTVYDKSLEVDVKRFQATHGLDPDGVIGAGTFRELNVPVSQRIETIRINLERCRWVSDNLPENYLIVNIAGFWLSLIKNGQVIHSANVVVGKTLNKTPIFRDKMKYIDFNPTWTVPRSIIKNEIIPKLKKDSLYLQKQNMILLDSKGNEVPLSSLDIPNLSPGKFPYMVRQQPGPDNALGVVKFMFPNDYDIYLHDTPSKSLFIKASRAFSHGCIRVDKPLDLAVKLLDGTEWTREKIDQTIKTRKTTRVLLPEPLDVLIIYWTCGLDRDRRLFFAPDVYDRDPLVLKQLNQLLR